MGSGATVRRQSRNWRLTRDRLRCERDPCHQLRAAIDRDPLPAATTSHVDRPLTDRQIRSKRSALGNGISLRRRVSEPTELHNLGERGEESTP